MFINRCQWSFVSGHLSVGAVRLHRDERGSISIATVFAVLFLTMLLGMVINVGRQVDNKVRLQNAADATTYSGGVVLARGMNTVAFTNHMLCEVFALTAFMREARDRHAEQFVPEVMAAWDRIGPVLARSGFEKFDRLGPAIPQKTPAEQAMVTAYGDWMAASSEVILPILEEILAQEMIPQFQREVVLVIPELSQTAAGRIAENHTGALTRSEVSRGQVQGVFWRTIVDPVGGASEGMQGSLPAVDPLVDMSYFDQAVSDRRTWAERYLDQWNHEMMKPFEARPYESDPDGYGQMSALGSRQRGGPPYTNGLWRGFTFGQLDQLLAEYPDRNLPHMNRRMNSSGSSSFNFELERDYMFVGVTYRPKLNPAMSRLFADSLNADNAMFAQGMLFAPRRRPTAWRFLYVHPITGVAVWGWEMTPVPARWDLWNEDWNFQLVPAQTESIPQILQAPPQTAYASAASGNRQPQLGALGAGEWRKLTTH